jgi:hypothetical protein
MDHSNRPALAIAAVVCAAVSGLACASSRQTQVASIPAAGTPSSGTGSSQAAPAAATPSAKASPAGSEDSATPEGAKTPDEQRERLDKELDKSLAAFDAMLLKEQQEVAAKRAEHGTSAGGGGEGPGGGGGEGGEGAASSGAGGAAGGAQASTATTGAEGRRGGREAGGRTKDQSTGSARGGDRGTGGREVTTAAEGAAAETGDSSNVPADVGDGRDDDVVARQLREAAMKESDPAIREKLWNEYRRYKRGGS